MRGPNQSPAEATPLCKEPGQRRDLLLIPGACFPGPHAWGSRTDRLGEPTESSPGPPAGRSERSRRRTRLPQLRSRRTCNPRLQHVGGKTLGRKSVEANPRARPLQKQDQQGCWGRWEVSLRLEVEMKENQGGRRKLQLLLLKREGTFLRHAAWGPPSKGDRPEQEQGGPARAGAERSHRAEARLQSAEEGKRLSCWTLMLRL